MRRPPETIYEVERITPNSFYKSGLEDWRVDVTQHRSLAKALAYVAARRHSLQLSHWTSEVDWFDVNAVRNGHYRHVARIEPYDGEASDWHQLGVEAKLEGFGG
jgi:hypothetical protein